MRASACQDKLQACLIARLCSAALPLHSLAFLFQFTAWHPVWFFWLLSYCVFCFSSCTLISTFLLSLYLRLSRSHSFSLHAPLSLSLLLCRSLFLCQTDGSCPWQHGSNHLEGLVLFFFLFALPPISMNSMCVNHVCSRHAHTLTHTTNCENTD